MDKNFRHLQQVPLFCQLTPHVIQQIESRSRLRKFSKGETIYRPGDLADGVWLLTSGRVRICNDPINGKQSILGFVEPDDLFGELVIANESNRTELAIASEKCEAMLIATQNFRWLMQQFPDFSLGIAKVIGTRRKRIEKRLRNLLFRNNRERVIFLLLELVEQYGESVGEQTQLKIKLSHQELASIIGSTRETVTVVLGRLQADGLVKVARRRIIILDLEQMAAEVGEKPPAIPIRTPFIRSQRQTSHVSSDKLNVRSAESSKVVFETA